MVNLTIDERKVQVEEGATILQVARENSIYIPTLCENEAVPPYGACRLCIVEVTARGRSRIVASCLYPVEEGLVVATNTERIARIRKTLIQLLLSRCPDAEEIQALARKLGVEEVPFKAQTDKNKCILCALCARTCQEVVGVSAISLVDRGVERQIATPFKKDISEACIGCGSCAYICPTGAITVEEKKGKRTIKWPHQKTEFKLKKCLVCGTYWAPEKQIEYIARISGTKPEDYETCPNCR